MLAADHVFSFEAYGVRVGLRSNSAELLAEMTAEIVGRLPVGSWREMPHSTTEHRFAVRVTGGGEYRMYRGRRMTSKTRIRGHLLRFLYSMVRITIAEHAVGKVFVHAGVVSRNGRAIVVPGRSFAGKTTLIGALVKAGAEYYSDEYAVFDEEGFVEPFPKPLSLRDDVADPYAQREVAVESLGGRQGSGRVPVGLIAITSYAEGGRWKPERLTQGQGILAIVSHAIPMTYNPKFTLKVLNNATKRAIILQSDRGDAAQCAVDLLSFFDSEVT